MSLAYQRVQMIFFSCELIVVRYNSIPIVCVVWSLVTTHEMFFWYKYISHWVYLKQFYNQKRYSDFSFVGSSLIKYLNYIHIIL